VILQVMQLGHACTPPRSLRELSSTNHCNGVARLLWPAVKGDMSDLDHLDLSTSPFCRDCVTFWLDRMPVDHLLVLGLELSGHFHFIIHFFLVGMHYCICHVMLL